MPFDMVPIWRRRWDSNPRGIAAKLISSDFLHWMQGGISGQYRLVHPRVLGNVCKQKQHNYKINNVGATETKKRRFCPNDTFFEKMQESSPKTAK